MGIKNAFSELLGTVVAVGVSAFIVDAITDLNVWTSVFIGYLVTELLASGGKTRATATEVQIISRKLDEAAQAAARLEEQVWDLKNQLEEQKHLR